MDDSAVLDTAMAEKCKAILGTWYEPPVTLPRPLQPAHLMWTCDRIEQHAEDWPAIKRRRWLGFIHCALLAGGMVDLQGVRSMFDATKIAHGSAGADLLDHLDPASTFEFDTGGES